MKHRKTIQFPSSQRPYGRATHSQSNVTMQFYGGKMNNLIKTLFFSIILFVLGLGATNQSHTPVALAQDTVVINVCSHNGTTNIYNILGSNATSLRAKLDNEVNFGPNGAYGDYDFNYIDVGDNFTKQTILGKACNIWFSGYEQDSDYTPAELTELQSWVTETNGQVIAGCDAQSHDPVCALLNFSVTTDTDTHGFLTNTGAINPLNCNGALGPNSRLEMAGTVGGYFSGTGVTNDNVLAVHESGTDANSKPIVIYTGNYFLTADINMIQTGGNKVTLSDGPDVTNNNDILAMNAFSALADASVSKPICTSVEPAPPPQPTCDCAAVTTASSSTDSGVLAGFSPVSIYSLDNGSAEDSIPDTALTTATGTIHGNPASTADRFGNANGALLFDGVDDYIETNEESNKNPLTFSVWFRADDISQEHSIVDSDVGGRYGHSLIIGYDDPAKTDDTPRDGSLDVQYHNGFWDTNVTIETGKWYHAFVTYDAEMRLYLGAQGEPMTLVAQQAYDTAAGFDGSNFRFGRHNNGDPQWFKGAMDDIRFYNEALTEAQIQEVTSCTCPEPAQPDPDFMCPLNSSGDVHITTPDNLVYDFQERNDFILSHSTNSRVVMLQARQEPWPVHPNRAVAVNTAVAMNVAGDTLEFYLKPTPTFYINGQQETALPTSQVTLPRGGALILTQGGTNDFTIFWPDNHTASRVQIYPNSHMNVCIKNLDSSLTYEGLLGNLDGNRENDVHTRDGATADIVPVNGAALRDFGNSWIPRAGESLFHIPHPTASAALDAPVLRGVHAKRTNQEGIDSLDTLTINDFDPEARAEAEATCADAGITDSLALYHCTYDLLATESDSFIASAISFEESTADIPDEAFAAATQFQGLPVPIPGGELAPTDGEEPAPGEPAPDDGEPAEEVPSTLDGLLANPLVLGGGGLLLLIILFLVFRRRR